MKIGPNNIFGQKNKGQSGAGTSQPQKRLVQTTPNAKKMGGNNFKVLGSIPKEEQLEA